MSTNVLSAKDIKRDWYLFDARDAILGRLATSIAKLLMGKNKPNYVPYLDTGDNVVVINAKDVKVTGKKETAKVYFRHSGFPGGDKREMLSKLRKRKPEEVIVHAVKGMLPKNKLGRQMVKKLHVFAGADHTHKSQEIKNAK